MLSCTIIMYLTGDEIRALNLKLVILCYNHVITMMPAMTRWLMDAAACPTGYEMTGRLRGEGLSFSCRI